MRAPEQPDAPLSLIGRLIRALSRWIIRAALHDPDPVRSRRRVLQLAGITLPAWGCRYTAATLGGVPVEWVDHGKAPQEGQPVLLYLHGGCYVVGSPRTHRAITSRLARDGGLRVVAADYRLAPEHPFPAALDDALAVYQAVLASGVAPQRLVIAGESAGGGLTLALALKLKELGLPQPAGLIAISPWVNLALTGESMQRCAKAEVVLSEPLLRTSAAGYAIHAGTQHPQVSPLLGDLAGLPPLLIQVGGQEILYSDAIRLHEAARRAGVAASLQEWRASWHAFHIHAGMMPEAGHALSLAAAYARAQVGGTGVKL